jgi:hypothetical protein
MIYIKIALVFLVGDGGFEPLEKPTDLVYTQWFYRPPIGTPPIMVGRTGSAPVSLS